MTKATRLDRLIANEKCNCREDEREELKQKELRKRMGLYGLEELQERECRIRAANDEIDFIWAEGCFRPESDKSWFRHEWEEEYHEWVVETNRALATKG